MDEESETNPALLKQLRELVQQYREKHLDKTALYWADKVASLSKYKIQDVYILAQCMFSAGEYERAALLIKQRKLHEKYSAFRYLAAKCYAEAKEWSQALDLLLVYLTTEVVPKKLGMDEEDVPGIPTKKEMMASIYLLKGDIYEAKDTRHYACQCYEEALRTDVFCYEAFDRLTNHHLLVPCTEQAFLESLPLSKQCKTDEEKELLQFMYRCRINLYSKPVDFEIPKCFDNLHENYEVATSLAERHYYSWEFRISYKITSGILRADPFHSQCLPLHVALLVVLNKSNELFYLAHRLVKRYPEKAVSWYAVGCYYLLQLKKQELTRRYLLKATLIDKMYGPAWLALGHSFALEGEHDQAMAAYFTATQLMRGSHLPYLYCGLEYNITNNTNLAERFFDVALQICPDDPHTLHEIGVACYTINSFDMALKYFNKAMKMLKINEEDVSEEWEALLNNLGHTCRKLKKYDQALEYHQQALVFAPHCAQTYSSIGFVLSYMGRYGDALEYLHKALGIKREDVFASSLIQHVIEQYAESEQPLYGEELSADDELGPPPPFPRNFGASEKEKSVDEQEDETSAKEAAGNQSLSSMEGSHTSQSPNTERTKQIPDTETPAQLPLEGKGGVAAVILEEGVEGFQTPEEFVISRIPSPKLCGTKKAPTKARRMGPSNAPPPLHFSEGTGASSADESGIITPVPSARRKMLSLVCSESSDDGGLVGLGSPEAEAAGESGEKMTTRFRAPSAEETWSTKVVKGGGGGFETGPEPQPDSVIMMLGDSVASVSDSSFPSASGSRASLSDHPPPSDQQTSAEADTGGMDMELDDTLD